MDTDELVLKTRRAEADERGAHYTEKASINMARSPYISALSAG